MDDRGTSFILVLPVNLAAGFGVKQPLQHMLKPLNSLCPGIAIGSGKPPTLPVWPNAPRVRCSFIWIWPPTHMQLPFWRAVMTKYPA